ncbi:MAG: cytochrome C oxidase subunit IV family protein [Candidatus Methylacidiphilales bacterium]
MSEKTLHTGETHDHGDHEVEHLKQHIKFYWIIFAALIVGTILTVGVPMVFHFENHAINVLIGMAIATVKAALVCLFFMHLSNEKRTIYVMIAFAVVFVIALFVLTALAYWNHTHNLIW